MKWEGKTNLAIKIWLNNQIIQIVAMTASCLMLFGFAALPCRQEMSGIRPLFPLWQRPGLDPSVSSDRHVLRRSNPVDVGSTPRSFTCGWLLRVIWLGKPQAASSKANMSHHVVLWYLTVRSVRYPMIILWFPRLSQFLRSYRLPRWNFCSDYVQI